MNFRLTSCALQSRTRECRRPRIGADPRSFRRLNQSQAHSDCRNYSFQHCYDLRPYITQKNEWNESSSGSKWKLAPNSTNMSCARSDYLREAFVERIKRDNAAVISKFFLDTKKRENRPSQKNVPTDFSLTFRICLSCHWQCRLWHRWTEAFSSDQIFRGQVCAKS